MYNFSRNVFFNVNLQLQTGCVIRNNESYRAGWRGWKQTADVVQTVCLSGELAQASLEGRNMADSLCGSWLIKYLKQRLVCQRPKWVFLPVNSQKSDQEGSAKFLIRPRKSMILAYEGGFNYGPSWAMWILHVNVKLSWNTRFCGYKSV